MLPDNGREAQQLTTRMRLEIPLRSCRLNSNPRSRMTRVAERRDPTLPARRKVVVYRAETNKRPREEGGRHASSKMHAARPLLSLPDGGAHVRVESSSADEHVRASNVPGESGVCKCGGCASRMLAWVTEWFVHPCRLVFQLWSSGLLSPTFVL